MRVERSLVVLTVATLLVFAAPASATSALSASGTAESIEPTDHPLSESEDAYLADLHEDDLIPGDNETGNVTDDIDDVADEGSDTVDDAGNTLDDATETVEDAEETVDGAEEAVGDVVDDTTDDADDVTDRATDTTEDVAGGTTGELDEILGETADIAVTETLRDSVTGTVVLPVEELDETVTKATSSAKEVTEGQNDDGETSENEDGSEQEDAPGEDSQTTTGETDPDYSTETTDGTTETSERAVDEGGSADDRGGVLATVLSGLGNALPGSNAGAGVTIGTGTLGALFLTRKFGTAATLSSATGSGSSLLAAITTALREWVVRLLAILGYKRFSDDDPLEHETREQLYEYICMSPGSYMSEISEEIDVPLQTARYHLRILEFENLVSDESVRGRRRYYPLGTDWTELAAALNDEATTAILETLAREGPDSVSGLAEKLDRDPSTISHHLDRLAEDGLVEREREGRAVVNRLSNGAETALQEGPATPAPPRAAGGAD